VANLVREGCESLRSAGQLAGEKLYRPELNFKEVTDLLESVAHFIESGLVIKAYGHIRRPNPIKSRAAKLRSPHEADNLKFFGRNGGISRSPAKQEAAKRNGKLGGRPRKPEKMSSASGRAEPMLSTKGGGGKDGGKVTSERKAIAARLNGKKGGRPKKKSRLLIGEVKPTQLSLEEI
jgi:hypothetical protein